MKRLKYGSSKFMTEEEKREHTHKLARKWRQAHKDKIKAQNKYYSELYKTVKPFECFCKICGKKFNARREYYKLCPQCIAENHYVAEMKRKTIALKQEERKAEYQQILIMRKMGIRQQVIANTLGRSQSGISAILRRLKNRPCKK